MRVDAFAIARRYIEARDFGRHLPTLVELDLETDLCIAVADWFEAAPDFTGEPREQREYADFKEETNRQFEVMLEAGVDVLPWLDSGQPYSGSKHLQREVSNTGRLYIYLTMNGHGQGGSDPEFVTHPMVSPSHYHVDGVPFLYNDVFRAVHDFFGHVARGNSFTARGEFMAAWDHCQMYPDNCHPVLLTESIGQICWFYFGPHLRDPDGLLPSPGSPGYVEPRDRPYSPQKTTPLPQEFVDAFLSLFKQVD